MARILETLVVSKEYLLIHTPAEHQSAFDELGKLIFSIYPEMKEKHRMWKRKAPILKVRDVECSRHWCLGTYAFVGSYGKSAFEHTTHFQCEFELRSGKIDSAHGRNVHRRVFSTTSAWIWMAGKKRSTKILQECDV